MPSPLQPFPRHHQRDPWRPADCPRQTGRTLLETLPEGVTNSYQYTVTANTVTETRMTDGNGNVTTYRFNGLGFPVKTIDALGRRIEKTVNGQTVQYLYDGDQAIAELQGSAIGATYLTGLQIDEVLARYGASGDRTMIADALGSVLAQTDGAGAVQTQYSYSPYGETQTSGSADGNPVQYTGRENDSTGLYYYRARYYDPQLKRFLSEVNCPSFTRNF